MKEVNKSIYSSGVKPYKVKKLFFNQNFRSLYYQRNPALTVVQCEYTLCTQMWLQRLREEDILIVMGWWYRRHGLKANWGRLRRQVIPDTYNYTRPILKEKRHAEYKRAKDKRQQKAGERRAI